MEKDKLYREFEEKWKRYGGYGDDLRLVCVETVVALLSGGLPMLFLGVNAPTVMGAVAWGAVALGLTVAAAVLRRKRARERKDAWREYQRLHKRDG